VTWGKADLNVDMIGLRMLTKAIQNSEKPVRQFEDGGQENEGSPKILERRRFGFEQ